MNFIGGSAQQGDDYISKEGYDAMKKELARLKDQRIRIAQKLEFAKSLGDLSENAEYAEAKEEHMVNEGKILETEDFLSRVNLIEKPMRTGTVSLGSTVVISDTNGSRHFTIVGTQEIDLTKGKISNESPLGHALMGKKKGDVVVVKGPTGNREYKIIDIE